MSRRSVVVAGASTGIGEATAIHLKALGFQVLGGVRKEEDAERLREAGLHPVKLDVTEAGSIASAREEIERVCGGRLDALVNNAGVAIADPLEYLPVRPAAAGRPYAASKFGLEAVSD